VIALTSGFSSTASGLQCHRSAALSLRPQLTNYVRARFPGLADPDDIVQEVYLRFFGKDRSGVANLKAFLFTIARNVVFDHHRRQVRSPVIDVTREQAYAVPSDAPTTPDMVARKQELELLRIALAQLPPRCREVLRLRIECHLSVREIAQSLAIAESTVEVQLVRARAQCQGYFAQWGLGGGQLRERKSPRLSTAAG